VGCAERPSGGDEIDRFQKIGFSLPVLAIEQIDAGRKVNLRFGIIAEIAEVK